MRILSKSDLLRVEITVGAPASISESLSTNDTPNSPTDKRVLLGLEQLEILVDSLGYENFQSEIIGTPYDTDRGVLYARGSFSGPPIPPASEDRDSRSPYAVSEYSYIIVKSEEEKFIIEVKHESANIARFKIDSKDISLLNGELPHV